VAYRLYSRSDFFEDDLGARLAGGTVYFYEPSSSTPKNVYSDSALSVNIGPSEVLDAAGRFSTAIWGSGSYRVVFKDSDGDDVTEDDPITDPSAANLSIPALSGHSGDFLTNNGSVLSWLDILSQLLPDMTGQADKLLSNDGTDPLWIAKDVVPTLPTEGVTVTSTKIQIGNQLLQMGTSSFPATGAQSTATSVTFGTAYDSAPRVWLQMDSASMYIHTVVDSRSATGFNASADTNIIGSTVSTSEGFVWIAWGTKAP